jgi:hypothetical protein
MDRVSLDAIFFYVTKFHYQIFLILHIQSLNSRGRKIRSVRYQCTKGLSYKIQRIEGLVLGFTFVKCDINPYPANVENRVSS